MPVAGGLLAYRPAPCLRPSSSHAPASALAVCAVPCASHHATDTAACRRADNGGKEFQPWSSHRISPAPTPGRKSHSASRRNRACAPVAPRASGNRSHRSRAASARPPLRPQPCLAFARRSLDVFQPAGFSLLAFGFHLLAPARICSKLFGPRPFLKLSGRLVE